MNKEQKVISLLLAKELQEASKEAGLELPESEYYWNNNKEIWATDNFLNDDGKFIAKAFDTAELGEILPNNIRFWRDSIENYTCKKYHPVYKTKDKTEAECRGKMLIYLIKNKLIKEL